MKKMFVSGMMIGTGLSIAMYMLYKMNPSMMNNMKYMVKDSFNKIKDNMEEMLYKTTKVVFFLI